MFMENLYRTLLFLIFTYFFLLFDHENLNIAQITLTSKDGLLVVKILLLFLNLSHLSLIM